MSVCRLCLSGRRVRHNLFQPLSPLIHKVRFCLPLEISQADNLPKKICDTCILKINDIYDYLHKTLNAEKELLANSFDLSNSVECTSDNEISDNASCKSMDNGHDKKCENDCKNTKISNEIKVEPPDTAVLTCDDNISANNGPCNAEDLENLSKYVSTYTQTDTLDLNVKEVGEPDAFPKQINFEEELFSEKFADSNLEFHTHDSNEYSSDDDIALNKIMKIPPIKVKIKREYSDQSSKKSKKRKKDIDLIVVKKARGRPKGSQNKKQNAEKNKKPFKDDFHDEMMIKSERVDDENLNVIENCEDDKFYSVKEENSKLWQCLTCFVYEKNRTDLLQHYKDHVENPSKLSISSIKTLIIKDEIKSETDDLRIKNETNSHSQDYIKVQSKEFSEDPAYQCLKCYKLFINKKSVIRHLICHDDSRPYPCNICGRTYKRAYEILLHGRAHSGVKTLFCRYELCNYSTAYRGALLSHHKRHEPDYKYTCEVCKKGFDVLTWFTEHKNVHTGDKPFSCNLCGKSFIYSRYLASHRKSVHPETNVRKLVHRCEKCNEEFPYRKKLQRHMQRVHDGDYAAHVLCDICGKRLSSKEHLKFHSRIHTGEKPHNCRTCGKSFVKKCNLTLHERIHSGERPHVCSHCGKAFSQRSTLVIHERYHSGARPYQCEICSKAFVAKGLLSMHQKTCI